MRRLVVALIAVSVVASLTGCGGGEEAQTPPPAETTVTAAPAPAAGSSGPSDAELANTFEPFPATEVAPEAISEDLEAGQPMLLLFADGSQQVTNEVRSAADAAVKEYGTSVTLHYYDLGEYTTVDESGTVVVDTAGLTEDQTASQIVTLATGLGVDALPYVIMVDDQGYIVFRHRGLVDADFLEMHMERLNG